jgi:hypothetical protein
MGKNGFRDSALFSMSYIEIWSVIEHSAEVKPGRIAGFIKRQASIDASLRWFTSIIGATESLGAMPAHCPMAPEAKELGNHLSKAPER